MSDFEKDLKDAISSGRPFRTEMNCITKEQRVVYLTGEEIRASEENTRQEQLRRPPLEVTALRDLQDYLFQWVSLRPDAPQSVKDFMALPPNIRRRN